MNKKSSELVKNNKKGRKKTLSIVEKFQNEELNKATPKKVINKIVKLNDLGKTALNTNSSITELTASIYFDNFDPKCSLPTSVTDKNNLVPITDVNALAILYKNSLNKPFSTLTVSSKIINNTKISELFYSSENTFYKIPSERYTHITISKKIDKDLRLYLNIDYPKSKKFFCHNRLHIMESKICNFPLDCEIDHMVHTWESANNDMLENLIPLSKSENKSKASTFDSIVDNNRNIIKVYGYADYTEKYLQPFKKVNVPLYIVISYITPTNFITTINNEQLKVHFNYENTRLYLVFPNIIDITLLDFINSKESIYNTLDIKNLNPKYVGTFLTLGKYILNCEDVENKFNPANTEIYFYKDYFEISSQECQKIIEQHLNKMMFNKKKANTFNLNIQHIHDIKISDIKETWSCEDEGKKLISKNLICKLNQTLYKK